MFDLEKKRIRRSLPVDDIPINLPGEMPMYSALSVELFGIKLSVMYYLTFQLVDDDVKFEYHFLILHPTGYYEKGIVKFEEVATTFANYIKPRCENKIIEQYHLKFDKPQLAEIFSKDISKDGVINDKKRKLW